MHWWNLLPSLFAQGVQWLCCGCTATQHNQTRYSTHTRTTHIPSTLAQMRCSWVDRLPVARQCSALINFDQQQQLATNLYLSSICSWQLKHHEAICPYAGTQPGLAAQKPKAVLLCLQYHQCTAALAVQAAGMLVVWEQYKLTHGEGTNPYPRNR